MSLVINGIPISLNEKLIEEYLDLKKRFSMNDWGPGQLRAGRLAEVLLRIFQHLLGEAVTPFGLDIPASDKTRILNTIQQHPTIDAHVRQKVVALTRLLLDFRNSRDVAHLGGFDANSMDTFFVMTAATWILCELIRVYSGYQMAEAQKIVDGLSVKEYPVIMEFDGELFLTRHNLTAEQEVLVLLTKNSTANANFLFEKTRDGNSTRFSRRLREMVRDKLIGNKGDEYFLMPRGATRVSRDSLLTYNPEN
jgi:hypothetical protein